MHYVVNIPNNVNTYNDRFMDICNLPIVQLLLFFGMAYATHASIYIITIVMLYSSRWRHNGSDGVSNHQPHDCLLNRLFRRISKKTSNSALLVFVRGIHWWPVNSQHKRPVTRKLFPFDDVIMLSMLRSLQGPILVIVCG